MNNNTKGAWLVHHAEKIKKYPEQIVSLSK
ncbi:hypothetical protein BANRA_01048 [Escherichia coli]|nr:hypothetical protein BANRA_01048 [Escherichia coli]